jgi:hypothetical protein
MILNGFSSELPAGVALSEDNPVWGEYVSAVIFLFPANPFTRAGYRHVSFEECQKCKFLHFRHSCFPQPSDQAENIWYKGVSSINKPGSLFFIDRQNESCHGMMKISVESLVMSPCKNSEIPLLPKGWEYLPLVLFLTSIRNAKFCISDTFGVQWYRNC